MKIISWNVNGLRSVLRKNFLDYLNEEAPDILCLQETKASPEQVEQLWPAKYSTFWNAAQKKGYAGTAIFTLTRPLNVTYGISKLEHDAEGRVIASFGAAFQLQGQFGFEAQGGAVGRLEGG